MTEAPFASFLARSLAALERDCPEAYAGIVERLGPRRVAIDIEGERVGVSANAGRLCVAPCRGEPAAAEASSTRRCLGELLDADCSLNQAILDDRVLLRGALDDLVAFHDALLVYFRGAVASPAFPELLDAFLGHTRPPPTLH